MPDLPRAITSGEADVVSWMVVHSSALGHLLSTVAALQVVWKCQCGCATVYFEPHVPEPRATVLAEATGKTVDGIDVGVILWGREQRISGLEIFGYERSDVGLPTLASLTAR